PRVKVCAGKYGLRSWERCGGGGVEGKTGEVEIPRLHANVARFDRKMVVKPSHVGVRVNNSDANKDTQSCKASLSEEGKETIPRVMKRVSWKDMIKRMRIENKILQVDLWMLRQVWGNNHFNFASTSAKGMPNHRLILLKEFEIDYGPTPYRFFHSWLEMEGFHNLVVHTWKNDGEIDRLETKDIAQKAKIKWAIEGDENTSFFYSMLKKKRRQLAIKGILKNEEWIEDPKYFKAEFMEHFRNRFQQPIGIPPSLDADSLNHLASSQKQSAFIKGRNILDGPLILNKVMAWYRKRKKKLMLFKVDFKKAFDSLRWDFLDFVMEKLGFGLKWRS
nr:RNA-directed DNA polymerase, eukaryota, reverse transcriptase zinc-binding domain protein [Tanacetum cinerariifolium]